MPKPFSAGDTPAVSDKTLSGRARDIAEHLCGAANPRLQMASRQALAADVAYELNMTPTAVLNAVARIWHRPEGRPTTRVGWLEAFGWYVMGEERLPLRPGRARLAQHPVRLVVQEAIRALEQPRPAPAEEEDVCPF